MNLKFTYFSLAMALALSACHSDDVQPPAPEVTEENPAYMSFSITMENPDGKTRSTRGEAPNLDSPNDTWANIDNEAKGTSFDIRLLGENFTPVILESDNKTVVGKFNILSYWHTETDEVVTYFIHGSFAPVDTDKYPTNESLKSATGLKLMVFANTPTNPLACLDDNDELDFTKLEYEYMSKTAELATDEDVNEPGFPAIPMWGVCPVDFSKLRQGSFTWINDAESACRLLRSMAKVSIQLKLGESQRDRVKIKSVTLNRYNKKGLVLPGTWNSVSMTTDIEYAQTLNEHTSSASAATEIYKTERVSKVIPEGATIAQDNVTFYLPEVSNINTLQDMNFKRDEGTEGCLELTLEYSVDGNDKENHLYFTPYASNGGPVKTDDGKKYQLGKWDVVRNHIYEFVITGVQDSKINVEARVKDWQYHKEVQPLE